jgi:membrane peptidoglycan carboxypeptidase
VLTPEQAADVDYAMSFDTQAGLGTAAGMGLTNGQTIIAKTGTTNLSQQAFFEGATPMDAMAVGMFVEKGGCTLPASEQSLCQSTGSLSYAPPAGLQTLFGVGGWAGYGGQWPAEIWHTYFMNEFNTLQPTPWPPVNNWGSPWNLVGQLPPAPKHNQPNPQPTCFGFGRHCKQGQGGGQPPPVPTPTPTTGCGQLVCPPTPTPTAQPTAGKKTG